MKHQFLAGSLALSLAISSAFGAAIPVLARTQTALTQTMAAENEYTYCYAGLTWQEYWAAEGVYNSDNVSSSDTADSKGEFDKGGFDAVTRATTNHGVHRGSFQCSVTIKDTSGDTHILAGWKDGTTAYIIDDAGNTLTYQQDSADKKKYNNTENPDDSFTLESYSVHGLKYVPVAVKNSDYAAFKAKYAVVENGGKLYGGFSEMNLSSYEKTASVSADTYGLKTAVKNADGSFSFSKKSQEGTASGMNGEALKTIDFSSLSPTLLAGEKVGSYGEFMRLDFTANYGELGSAMQAATWTYYGNDSTLTHPLCSYGTKFAADNWMHKKLGIQLGLTDSIRCQLPAGYDGTGHWTVTISALGYKDGVYAFEASSDNIFKEQGTAIDTTSLEALVTKASALKENDYTSGWKDFQTELTEAVELLENIKQGKGTQAAVDEQVKHLTDAMNALVKKTEQETPSTEKKPETSTTEKKPETPSAPKKQKVSLSKPSLNKPKAAKKNLKITWKKVKKANGYEVQYSTTKKFKKAKTVTVKKTSAQLNKLQKKKKYYVRVRAFSKKSGYLTAYSKWSKVVTAKTK